MGCSPSGPEPSEPMAEGRITIKLSRPLERLSADRQRNGGQPPLLLGDLFFIFQVVAC